MTLIKMKKRFVDFDLECRQSCISVKGYAMTLSPKVERVLEDVKRFQSCTATLVLRMKKTVVRRPKLLTVEGVTQLTCG